MLMHGLERPIKIQNVRGDRICSRFEMDNCHTLTTIFRSCINFYHLAMNVMMGQTHFLHGGGKNRVWVTRSVHPKKSLNDNLVQCMLLTVYITRSYGLQQLKVLTPVLTGSPDPYVKRKI